MLTIPSRFRGPARSGNGGYTAGLLAAAVGADTVTVTLRVPPPLGTALDVVRDGDGVRLVDGDRLVAVAAPGTLAGPPPPPVAYPAAVAAAAGFPGRTSHPFPTCFTCGPGREAGDGLRLEPGPVGEGLVAAAWVPSPDVAGPGGVLPVPVVWAALDCPGGWSVDLVGRPMVLGRLTARVDVTPSLGDRCVVVGRRDRVEGRKAFTATALYREDGRLLAAAEAVWLAVDPATFDAL